MKKIGWIYGIIHLLVEIISFQIMYKFFDNAGIPILIALVYDFLAFVPQSLIGMLADKYTKLNIGHIGCVMLAISILLTSWEKYLIIALVFLGIGNALIHEAGAIATTVNESKLAPSAIFVAGGSFGLIIGQALGIYDCSLWYSVIALLIMTALIYYSNASWLVVKREVPQVAIVKANVNEWFIILVAFMIVAARSFIGYAIPISWKKELWQAFVLFFAMGLGKALGGILSDKYGAQKVGVLSTLLCIPFLLLGKNRMGISILGVFLFSMTMSITFGMLLSVLRDMPGVAFGITTIGLFTGLLPVFIFGMFDYVVNGVLIVVLSFMSAYGLYKTLK